MRKIRDFLKPFLASSPKPNPPQSAPRPLPTSVTRIQVDSKLQELTESPIWQWETFRGVLICLATLGAGRHIPAARRPNSIFLDGLQATFSELRNLSKQRQGRETSRLILVDKQRSCLIISGKTHVGSADRVSIDMAPEPGHEFAQIPVLAIHVHPDRAGEAGFSDVDYVSFLSDRRLIVMAICIPGGILLAMKTSATPKTITAETAQRLISVSRSEIRSIWSRLNLPESVVAFNKAVCTEFAMTLYRTTDTEQNVARRIEVTIA